MTICECLTYICTCGSAFQDPKVEADEYLEKYKIEESEEGEDVQLVMEKVVDKEGAEEIGFSDDENLRLLTGGEARVLERGCCMRLICLVFCCDTSGVGSQAHMNSLNE